jgi:peptidoglycan/xylan/chitin deacetylase (PgdA/CDA1 family)
LMMLATLCAASLSSLAAGTKQIAISIDDLPVASTVPVSLEEIAGINSSLLRVLNQHRARAIGFVNEDRLYRKGQVDARIDVLRSWLDAGMELGNHNFGHLGLWASSLADVEDAVVKGEVITRMVTAERHAPLRFYRPPNTQTGRDESEKIAFESFLASRNYRVAPFTIEHDDYLYGCVYDRSPAEADRRRVVKEYVSHLKESVEVFETMSQELFGRQIPQILLIHASRLNARSLDETLRTLESYGYQFISIDQAMSDPAYRSAEHASGRFGPSWLARWARASGTKLTVYGQPDPSGWSADRALTICGDNTAAEF